MINGKSILKEAELNLLRYSNHIKNTESPVFCSSIFSKKKIYPRDMNPIEEKLIIDKKIEWLTLSSNEWTIRKEMPLIINPSNKKEDWKRCSLCNTKNKNEFYIINKYNNKIINIGGSCKDNIITGDINELAKVIYTEQAGNRYNDITLDFPDIKDIILTPNKLLSDSKYEVPKAIETEQKKIVKKIKSALKIFLNNSDDIKDNYLKDKLIETLKEYDAIRNEIRTYNNQAKKGKWYLSKEMKASFTSQNNNREIVEEIKVNRGKLNKKILEEIRAENFLNTYIKKDFNLNTETKNFQIKNCEYGIIYLTYSPGGDLFYSFKVASNLFLKKFGLNILDNKKILNHELAKFFIEHAADISCGDELTERKLINLVDFSIIKDKKFVLVDFYPWFDSKFNDYQKEKFEQLTSQWRIYKNSKNQKLLLIRTDKLIIKYAIIMVFQDDSIYSTTLQSLMNNAEIISRKELNKHIKDKIYNPF